MANFYEEEPYKSASERHKTLGSLGVTAEDHKGIGSSPPDELIENPGKTMADLMTDDEILSWLQEHKEEIEEWSKEEFKKDALVQSILSSMKPDFRATLNYLAGINRLPEEFREA